MCPEGKCCHPKGKEHIGQIINYTSREIGRTLDNRIAAQVSPELSGARGMMLARIVKANATGRVVCQRDVEEWFHVRRSSVTAMLQGLEQDGFITRVPVENDARLKSLLATEKGCVYQQRVDACIAKFEKEFQEGISREEIDALRGVLHRLIDNIHRFENQEK